MTSARVGDRPPLTLAQLRAEVERWPAERGLYRLCHDAPPLDPRRPPANLRWLLFSSHYVATAGAYALGAAGAPLPEGEHHFIWRAAWLAGLDATAAHNLTSDSGSRPPERNNARIS